MTITWCFHHMEMGHRRRFRTLGPLLCTHVAQTQTPAILSSFYFLDDILGEGNGTPLSTLAWKIPWTEEAGGLPSMGSWRVGHDWATSLSLFTFMLWRRNGNPLQCSCLENPRDGGAWWAAVYGVARSRTRLKLLSSNSSGRWHPTFKSYIFFLSCNVFNASFFYTPIFKMFIIFMYHLHYYLLNTFAKITCF